MSADTRDAESGTGPGAGVGAVAGAGARGEEGGAGGGIVAAATSKEAAGDPDPPRTPDIYDRFSRGQKRAITAVVSYNAFLSPMTASIFLPSIPNIASDLSTTATIINVTVALFIVAIGCAPLIWSPLSGFYGRRPIYLASMPIMLVASIGVAFSRTVPQLIATRMLQGIGSSSTLAVGAGSIGDVYRPTERSNAMGWFYTGALIGPSISPIVGAAFTEYTPQTWRSVQFFLAGCSAVSLVLTYFFLPETAHPPVPHDTLRKERGKKFVPFWFNPLAILGLFGWLNISCITFISSATMLMTYVILVPITTAFQRQYGIDNVFLLGLLYLGPGGGNIIGSRIIGPMADATVKRYLVKRGYRRPEDRLRASVFGLGCVMPLTCLAYGWLLETSAGGVGAPVVFMVLQGVGLMLTLTPINTYAVDAMQNRSAEVIAVNNFMRYLFAAAASAFVLPMAESIGWGLTMTVASIIVWIGFGILLLVIRYGHIWRESANRRYGYVYKAADEAHGDAEQAEQTETETEPVQTSAGAAASTGVVEAPARAAVVAEEHGAETALGGGHEDEVKDVYPPPADHAHAQSAQPTPAPAAAAASTKRPLGRSVSRVSRTSNRDDMPEVKDVLRRTTSLSAASVHGGG